MWCGPCGHQKFYIYDDWLYWTWLIMIDVDGWWDYQDLIFFYFAFNVIDYKLFPFLGSLEIYFPYMK